MFLSIILSLLFLSTVQFTGPNIAYRSTQQIEAVEVIDFDNNGITVRFNLTMLETESIFLEEYGNGIIFSIPGAGRAFDFGFPDVPVLRKMVRVPDFGEIDLEIISSESQLLGTCNIPPSQPIRDRSSEHISSLRIDQEFYNGSETYPDIPVEIESVNIIREIRVAWVKFQPVSFNPSTGEVEITTSVTFRISAGPGKGDNELLRSVGGITRSFLPIYEDIPGFQNSGNLIDGSYVFISTQEGLDLVEDLIDWKNRKGYQVETGLIPDIGTTPDDIDNWIENAYNTWPNPPEYILIVGDETVVPPPEYGGFAADNIYGVIGSGCVPSIHVGRLTGEDTDDLSYQAWKITEHEMNPYEPADSWFHKGISIGHNDFINNSWEYVEYMMAAGMTVSWFCNTGGLPVTIQALSDSLNSGCSMFGICGHGDITHIYPPGFSNSDVADLTNGRKLPWMVLVACQTGMFDGYYCFSEACMSEGTITDPKGAIGVMSPTTNSPIGPADSLAKWIFEGYFEDEIRHMGAVTDLSKAEVFAYFGGSATSNNHMHMIFGCPEMDIYYDTSPISLLECDHPDPVFPGAMDITVTSDAQPVEGALVAIRIIDPDESIWMDSDYSNASGIVSFIVPDFTAGSIANITATSHNKSPYLYEAVTGTGTETLLSPFSASLSISPTPFCGATSIFYCVPFTSQTSIRLYDISGRMVRKLCSENAEPGNYSLVWNGTDFNRSPLPSGIYFCRLQTATTNLVKSVVILR